MDFDGCFEISLAQAYETELFQTEIKGLETRDYFGASLDLSVTIDASADIAAGVEFCLNVEPGLILQPKENSATQRMAVAGIYSPDTQLPGESNTRVAFSAEAGLETRLEAYCNDESKDRPYDDPFQPTDLTAPALSSILQKMDEDEARANYWVISQCLWAARSLDADYVDQWLAEMQERAQVSGIWAYQSSTRIDCEVYLDQDDVVMCRAASLAFGSTNPAFVSDDTVSLLASWIEQDRQESFYDCPLVICDEDCEAERLGFVADRVAQNLSQRPTHHLGRAGDR